MSYEAISGGLSRGGKARYSTSLWVFYVSIGDEWWFALWFGFVVVIAKTRLVVLQGCWWQELSIFSIEVSCLKLGTLARGEPVWASLSTPTLEFRSISSIVWQFVLT